jgi:hypothetical protein
LSMLMQPLFPGGKQHVLKAKEFMTNVKLLLFIYHGARYNNETIVCSLIFSI